MIARPSKVAGWAAALAAVAAFPLGLALLYRDPGIESFLAVIALGAVVAAVAGLLSENRAVRASERAARSAADQAQRRVRITLESISDAVYGLDRGWRFTYLNPSGETFLGRPAEELLGRSIWEEYPEAVGGELYHAYQRAMSERVVVQREVESSIRPGRWLAATAYPSEEGILIFVQETTESRRAERSLKESEARFRLMVEGSEEVFFYEHDEDGRFTYLSPSVENVLGYAAADLMGRPYTEFIADPGDEGEIRAWTEATLANGGATDAYQIGARHRDGRTVVLELVETPVVGDDQQRVQGFARNVTARVEAEDALRASEAHLRQLMEGVRAIVWECRARTWEMTYISAGVVDILGYEPEEWYADPELWPTTIHPDDRVRVLRSCRDALEAGRHQVLEYRSRARDGRTVWLRDLIQVVRNGDGPPELLRGVMIDITEERQLRDQLQQAQKMDAVGRLAGGVAHDFNNVLTAIQGRAEFLLDELDPDDARREDASEIAAAATRGAELTGQLLAFSRQQLIQPRVLDLNRTIAETERMLRRLIGEDVVLETALSPELGPVRADPGRIQQVLMNLVVNARDAVSEGGRITIATRNVELDGGLHEEEGGGQERGPYVLLAIADDGDGIDRETQRKMFEPFFTTKQQGKGTGLGLATVYGIVQQSGGQIRVFSEPGKGTTVKVYLPRAIGEPAEPGGGSADIGSGTGTETILVVEDEAPVRAVVRKVLQQQGYTVMVAETGEEALRVAEAHEGPIHLVLTDVVMPGMGGRKVADLLLESRPDTRVVFMSGYTQDEIMRRGIEEASVVFLEKPFSPTQLGSAVRRTLDGVSHGS